MNRISRTGRLLLLGGLLAGVTMAVFWPVLRDPFINLDDGYYVTLNSQVRRGLSWPGMWWALTTGFQASWHPLTWLSHMLDTQLFGLHPAGHHLTNLVLHLANVLLLFLLLERLTAAPWRSAVVAALFALHPLHVEPVAWVSSRKDVLSTLFFLLTLLAYNRYVEEKRPAEQLPGTGSPPAPAPERSAHARWYWLALGFFACGLMSKAMVVTLPCVLLLLDYWPLRRFEFKTQPSGLKTLLPFVREKLPFFALALVSSVVTALVMGRVHGAEVPLPLDARLSNAVVSYGKYLWQTIWPARLTLFYPHPWLKYAGAHPGQPLPITDWLNWKLVLALLLLLVVSLWAMSRRTRQPWFAVGWFWYVGTLVPVSGLLQVGSHAMADRYTYIPLIGIFIVVVWAAAELFQDSRFAKAALPAAAFASIAACAAGAHHQLGYWQDNQTAFAHALAVTTDNSLALEQLAHVLKAQGDKPGAMSLYREAIKAQPNFAATAYGELGVLLEEAGQTNEALALYETGLRAAPWAVQLDNRIANLLWNLGRQQEALAHYQHAIRGQPAYPDAHYNFGLALASRHEWPEAATQFAAVVKLKPDDADAMACLAETLLNQGQAGPAEYRFREVLSLNPTNASAHLQLAVLLAQKGSLDEALNNFQAAATLRPDWPDALNGQAWLLATHPQPQKRNPAEAVRLAERACTLTSRRQARFLSTLDAAYAAAGRFADAIHTAEEARALAQAAGQSGLVEAADARLALYRQGTPFSQ